MLLDTFWGMRMAIHTKQHHVKKATSNKFIPPNRLETSLSTSNSEVAKFKYQSRLLSISCLFILFARMTLGATLLAAIWDGTDMRLPMHAMTTKNNSFAQSPPDRHEWKQSMKMTITSYDWVRCWICFNLPPWTRISWAPRHRLKKGTW